ncbi:MAG: hypothetical protein J6B68_01120 [Lachnospiraceae bacterium]|nr:hypothetical protein [Lachnospiraceae bacterium]
MIFEQFKTKVCSALKEVMGEEYEIAYKEVTKNNGVVLRGIIIAKEGSNVSPTIYIDELYDDYKEGRAFGDIIYDILCAYQRSAKEIQMDMNFFTQYAQVKKRVLYKLIHLESNRKLLEDIPYVKWNDLAIVFYYAMEEEYCGKATILIRNSHLKMWGIDVDTLYQDAKANMTKLLPEELLPIKKIIQEFLSKNLQQEIEEDEIGLSESTSTMMYVLSNRDRIFGAASILYSEAMKELTKKLNKNLIILPSSVHEVILVPDNGTTEKSLFKDMVKEVNDTQVEPEEILSYSVYYYDRITEKIKILA